MSRCDTNHDLPVCQQCLYSKLLCECFVDDECLTIVGYIVFRESTTGNELNAIDFR